MLGRPRCRRRLGPAGDRRARPQLRRAFAARVHGVAVPASRAAQLVKLDESGADLAVHVVGFSDQLAEPAAEPGQAVLQGPGRLADLLGGDGDVHGSYPRCARRTVRGGGRQSLGAELRVGGPGSGAAPPAKPAPQAALTGRAPSPAGWDDQPLPRRTTTAQPPTAGRFVRAATPLRPCSRSTGRGCAKAGMRKGGNAGARERGNAARKSRAGQGTGGGRVSAPVPSVSTSRCSWVPPVWAIARAWWWVSRRWRGRVARRVARPAGRVSGRSGASAPGARDPRRPAHPRGECPGTGPPVGRTEVRPTGVGVSRWWGGGPGRRRGARRRPGRSPGPAGG